MLYQHW